MYDTIVKVSNSKIQHGVQSDRIYLMHLAKEDMPEILDVLNYMANMYGYTKIFAKVPDFFSKDFLENGYVLEATVPQFFNGEEDCFFMGKYISDERSVPVDQELNKKVLDNALLKSSLNSLGHIVDGDTLASEFSFKKAEHSDVSRMAELYSKVFDSYPFPIFDPEYIEETMNNNVIYFGIWKDDEIVALSSSEMCIEDGNVEMTDFAVHPEYRGYNFSRFLLVQMEKEMKKNKMKIAYTIARSGSYGMNNTFASCGYEFSGVLVRNTQIGGKIEDMNVWFKAL